jgi:hypothetical protein
MIAVGYARAMQGSPLQQGLLHVPRMFVGMIFLAIVADIVDLEAGEIFLILLLWTVGMLWQSNRIDSWDQMKRVHAAALWVTERADPPPPAQAVPEGSAPELAVRNDAATLWLLFEVRIGWCVIATFVLMGLLEPLPGLIVGMVLFVLLACAVVVTLVRHPQVRAEVRLRADGLEFKAGDLMLPWSAFTEIRIVPTRGKRAYTGARIQLRCAQDWHRTVVFVAADPEALISALPPSSARNARASLEESGGPFSVADRGLDRTAEEIAAAASALSGLPVRRFG